MKRRHVIMGASVLFMNVSKAIASIVPNKPIRWLVGYAAGGGSDFVARTIAEPLSRALGQPIIVENKPGANTMLAAIAAKNSPPDGSTILSADSGTIIYNPLLFKNLQYDPKTDFQHVGFAVKYLYCLVCNPNFPAKNVNELIKYVKNSSTKIHYASPGIGSAHHLTTEIFAQAAGIELVHTPYKGSAFALQDIMAGVVPIMFVDMPAAIPLIKSGKVRALGIATKTRSASLPNVPTLSEEGIQGIDTNSWSAVSLPKGASQELVNLYSTALKNVLETPKVQKKLTENGLEVFTATPEEVNNYIINDTPKWTEVIKRLNISLD